MPGRTDNEIKNYWNTHIKRKLYSRGIDPQTHRPLNAATTETTPSATTTNLSNTKTNSSNNSNNSSKSSPFEVQNYMTPVMQMPEFKNPMNGSVNASVKVGNESAEESNCSSGETTEDVFPDLNLELSIGLPYKPQIPSINIKEQRQQQQQQQPLQQQRQQQQQVSYQWYGNFRQGVCLCCHLGFQNSQACSCKATGTTVTADNLYRYYRPLNSWSLELVKWSLTTLHAHM